MNDTLLYRELGERNGADPKMGKLMSLVDDTFEECRQIHKTVLRHMPEYTLHDEEHLVRVVELMGRLLPPSTLEFMSPLELAALMLSACLHDIGMAPSEEEVRGLLSGSSSRGEHPDTARYRGFREGYSHVLKRQDDLRAVERHFEAQELEAYLLSKYLRGTHGERGKKAIFDRFAGKLVYGEYDFGPTLGRVCESHTQDPTLLSELRCWELVQAPGEYVNWRFVAVMLRLADILDFDAERTPDVLFEQLGIREQVSVKQWKKHRSVRAWDIGPGRVAFSATCPDPVIEKCVRDFAEQIARELASARGLLTGMHDPRCSDMRNRYQLDLPPAVDVSEVGPEEGPSGPIYRYVDLGFHLDDEGVRSLLMGLNLYGNPLLFLRELLQNAVDTCRHRQALHRATQNAPKYTPRILVELYPEDGQWFLAVEDDGMGMDDGIVRDHFARIGRSYYHSDRFLQEKAEARLAFQPIASFGIGVLAVFMVADHLRVETRKLQDPYDLDSPINIEIDGPSGLFWFRPSGRKQPGTRIVLALRSSPHSEAPPAERAGEPRSLHWALGESTLRDVIADLAPHVEYRIEVSESGRKRKVKGHWRVPEKVHRGSSLKLCRQVEIDLTAEGPDGLNGIARILLLKGYEDKPTAEVGLVRTERYYPEAEQYLSDKLQQRCGVIEYVHIDYSPRDDQITHAYSPEIWSTGRWSQQGFRVPQPLFVEHSSVLRRAQSDGSIEYPFVVHYDLDLSGEFTVNLTTDRLRPIPDGRWDAVVLHISNTISTLLLRKLGASEAPASESFFKEVLSHISDDSARDSFEWCLREFGG